MRAFNLFRNVAVVLLALAIINVGASLKAKAEPVTMSVGAFVAVTVGAIVFGAVAATAISAKRNGCGWVNITNQNGVSESVYVCSRG